MRSLAFLRIYFLFLCIAAFLAAVWMLFLPSEGARSGFLGISISRWLLVLGLGTIGILFGGIYILIRRDSLFGGRMLGSITKAVSKDGVYFVLVLIAVLGILIEIYAVWFARATTDKYLAAWLVRLLPLFSLFSLGTAATLVLARLLRFGCAVGIILKEKRVILVSGIVWLSLLLSGVFVVWTRLGLTRDQQVGLGWGDPGVPLLGYQVLIAYLISGLLSLFAFLLVKGDNKLSEIWHKFLADKWIDGGIFLILWITAAVLWSTQPQRAAYFSPAPRAPDFEFYPFSDAADYDRIAQSLWVGNGFGDLPKRPLYAVFLMGLHILGKDDYALLASLQAAVLAVFPALVYLLGALLNFRGGGLFAAILIIFREVNAQRLAGVVDVSHTKLLMSDVPAAVGVVIFTLLLVYWLQNKRRNLTLPILCGGWLGCLMLLRSQTVFLFLVVVVAVFWSYFNNWKEIYQKLVLFSVGMALIILPWLVRNGLYTGRLVFEEEGQSMALKKRYWLALQGEDGNASENGVDLQPRMLFSREGMQSVAGFISEHFMHNQVSAVFSLPVTFRFVDNALEFYQKYPYWQRAGEPPLKLWEECCSLPAYVEQDVPYWRGWEGQILPNSTLPILINLGFIAVGICAAGLKRNRVGFIPLLVFFAYSLSDAFIRSSGWRYILPADWAVIFYYALGIMVCSTWLLSLLKPDMETEDNRIVEKVQDVEVERLSGWKQVEWRAVLLVLLFGLVIAFGERMIPQRYSVEMKENIIQRINADKVYEQFGMTQEEWRAFQEQKDAVISYGKILYPKYFSAGDYEPWYGNWLGAKIRRVSQLNFFFLGTDSFAGAMPITEARLKKEKKLNGSEVLILGCQKQGHVEVKTMWILPFNIIIADPLNSWSCSSVESTLFTSK